VVSTDLAWDDSTQYPVPPHPGFSGSFPFILGKGSACGRYAELRDDLEVHAAAALALPSFRLLWHRPGR
jgi:hypothetical protein